MNVLLRVYPKCSGGLLKSISALPSSSRSFSKYSAHRDPSIWNANSPGLSQSLDTNQARPSRRHEAIGPFQLGLSPSALNKSEKVKSWSELTTGGKVIRGTARTTNLAVILLGAGLSALLVYSLTTELFSKNSPTVLYGEACERLKASPRLCKYLNGPLIFHNNPPSSVRPRHRNRHVTSQIFMDSSGREHMIMTFYVQGQSEGFNVASSNMSYFKSAKDWAQDKITDLPELTVDRVIAWTKNSASGLLDQARKAFRYLSGAPVHSSPSLPPFHREEDEVPKAPSSSAWNFAGMFSSLRGAKSGSIEQQAGRSGRTFTEGEVHADLVMNNAGYYDFRYLLVDLPVSSDRNSVRVFVERAPGVRENEPVMRWNS